MCDFIAFSRHNTYDIMNTVISFLVPDPFDYGPTGVESRAGRDVRIVSLPCDNCRHGVHIENGFETQLTRLYRTVAGDASSVCVVNPPTSIIGWVPPPTVKRFGNAPHQTVANSCWRCVKFFSHTAFPPHPSCEYHMTNQTVRNSC